jgi:hypothetical protein
MSIIMDDLIKEPTDVSVPTLEDKHAYKITDTARCNHA